MFFSYKIYYFDELLKNKNLITSYHHLLLSGLALELREDKKSVSWDWGEWIFNYFFDCAYSSKRSMAIDCEWYMEFLIPFVF
jgi:hypothetical protein